MLATEPHYVLFSRVSADEDMGHWSFTLQPVDGSPAFFAEDEEPGLQGERLVLLALVRALEYLDQPSQITVFCDHSHIRRQLSRGLDEWREADWKWELAGDMVPIANADLWRRLDNAVQIHRVECRPAGLQPFLAELNESPQAIETEVSRTTAKHGPAEEIFESAAAPPASTEAHAPISQVAPTKKRKPAGSKSSTSRVRESAVSPEVQATERPPIPVKHRQGGSTKAEAPRNTAPMATSRSGNRLEDAFARLLAGGRTALAS